MKTKHTPPVRKNTEEFSKNRRFMSLFHRQKRDIVTIILSNTEWEHCYLSMSCIIVFVL